MSTTARQQIALIYFYVEGRSYGHIGKALGISAQAAHGLIERGRNVILHAIEDKGVDALPYVERLLHASPTMSPTRHVGRALSRQEELLDALQLRLEQRDAELAMYAQWLDSDSHLPTHCKRNPYDQWEMCYLHGRKGEPLPTTAYNAATAAASCAMNGRPCPLHCAGCRQGR